MSKALAEVKSGAVVGFDYGEDAGTGFEGSKSSDISIPFINVMQSNTPAVARGEEGARPGVIFNTVTKEKMKELALQPVLVEHLFVEWKPLDQGGGYVGPHDPESDVVRIAIKANDGKAYGKLKTAGGNELIETYYLYAMVLNADGTESEGFCVIPLASSKIKPYKQFNTAMQMLKGKPPIFANRAKMITVDDKNQVGQPYKNVEFSPLVGTNWRESLINPSESRQLLEDAKAFRQMVLDGKAKVATDSLERDDLAPAGGSSKRGGNAEDAPF